MKARGTLRIIAATLAALSLGANVLLVRHVLRLHRSNQALRLDPAQTWTSAPGPSSPSSLLFLGDSRIHQWSPLPQIPGHDSVNLGVPAQTTAQVLLRLDAALTQRPRILILQVGINDLKNIGLFPQRRSQIIDACRSNLQAIIDRTARTNTHLVVLTIFPVGPIELGRRPFWSDATLSARDEINRFLLSLPPSPSLTVFDADPILAAGGRTRPDYARDALHLTPSAYTALNSALQPILTAGGPEARGRVRFSARAASSSGQPLAFREREDAKAAKVREERRWATKDTNLHELNENPLVSVRVIRGLSAPPSRTFASFAPSRSLPAHHPPLTPSNPRTPRAIKRTLPRSSHPFADSPIRRFVDSPPQDPHALQ